MLVVGDEWVGDGELAPVHDIELGVVNESEHAVPAARVMQSQSSGRQRKEARKGTDLGRRLRTAASVAGWTTISHVSPYSCLTPRQKRSSDALCWRAARVTTTW